VDPARGPAAEALGGSVPWAPTARAGGTPTGSVDAPSGQEAIDSLRKDVPTNIDHAVATDIDILYN
jgi:hypothetical protein